MGNALYDQKAHVWRGQTTHNKCVSCLNLIKALKAVWLKTFHILQTSLLVWYIFLIYWKLVFTWENYFWGGEEFGVFLCVFYRKLSLAIQKNKCFTQMCHLCAIMFPGSYSSVMFLVFFFWFRLSYETAFPMSVFDANVPSLWLGHCLQVSAGQKTQAIIIHKTPCDSFLKWLFQFANYLGFQTVTGKKKCQLCV